MDNAERFEPDLGKPRRRRKKTGGMVGKMLLWWEVSQPAMKQAQRKYWIAILADPEQYGDVLEEARQKMAALETSAKKARERYEYLLSLKEET